MKMVIAGLVGLLLSVGAEAAALSGQVRFADGLPVAGSQVMVFDLADLRRGAVAQATTDEAGGFVLSLESGLPAGFSLGQNYPNPFNPGTVIPYELASLNYVRLEVFNLLGQRVATLVDGEQAAGAYQARWDGTDASGGAVSAGVYLYRLTAGAAMATGRMVLVDGQAGLPMAGAAQGPVWSAVEGPSSSYSLVVSGPGVVAYVDADFRVGLGPVEVVVEAASPAAGGKTTTGGILGDVNDDGQVDVYDVLLVVLYSGDSSVVVPGDISLGDVNGDGQIDAADAFLIALYSVNPSDPALPAGLGEPVAARVNQAPVLRPIGDQSVPPGGTLTFELVASDPDGDALTYGVSGHPAGSSLSGSTFSWTPTETEETSHEVAFTVEDGQGGTDGETITLRVVEFRFELIEHQIETGFPSFVNILFQVLDEEGQGVPFLTVDHFEVRENDQVVSPTESAMYIRKREAFSYSFGVKTVLMLDTSASIGPYLEQIKTAAITLVRNKIPGQEIAVYEFSDEPVLLQDFTADGNALVAAIESIRLGFATTNLYGSVIEGSRRWRDVYTTTEFEQGFMVLLTDGSDTQGAATLSSALSARGDRKLYTIGLGNEIEPDVLEELGNAGFFHIADVSELAERLASQFGDIIQAELDLLANSYYWLNYLSPKRGNKRHTLELSLKGNQHRSTVRGNFNSGDFVSVRPGVTVNLTRGRLEGIEALGVAPGDTVRLEAVTFFGTASPRYRWESSASDIVSVESDSVDAGVARVLAVGDSGRVTLTVFDEANGFDRQVEVEVLSAGRAGVSQTFSLPGGASIDFVWIAPGVFQMGSPDTEAGRWEDEGPVHEVEISRGFWLGKYEVTQGEWEAVMGETPWSGWDYVRENPSHPAVYISWHDVQRFIGRLNAAAGDSLYRLPTEAEWEYACRAGTSTRWSFGDYESQLTGYAWYWDNACDVGECYGYAVGQKRPNPWGLYDMHGNVYEWVQDWYDFDYYNRSPRVDPPGPTSGSGRVIRGGGFVNYARYVRSAFRFNRSPDYRNFGIGVRLLRIR